MPSLGPCMESQTELGGVSWILLKPAQSSDSMLEPSTHRLSFLVGVPVPFFQVRK